MTSDFSHLPVLLNECIEGLAIHSDGTYLDGTAGGAGHSAEIARRLDTGRLFAIDRDPDAIAAATERLSSYSCARVIEGNFSNAASLLEGFCDGIDGALLDLGVSSHQLDCAERGFSYMHDGALDMRMSQSGKSAADIVNELDVNELAQILRDYGEEPYAKAIANRIALDREKEPITTTVQLANIVASALPPAVRRKEKNPSRRTFQALRIAVNDELGSLEEGLEEIFSLLNSGGRFCVITFHSLEDRIVKHFFADKATGCICPPDFPVCVCGRQPQAVLVNRKPIVATEQECENNRRSRSAKLRIIEKI